MMIDYSSVSAPVPEKSIPGAVNNLKKTEQQFDIIVRKRYVSELSSCPVKELVEPVEPVDPKEKIGPLNWLKVTKIVYDKDVFFPDKMAILYSALHESAGSVVMVIQKKKKGPVDIFLGTRDEKGSNNVSSQILEHGLKGILPGLQFNLSLAPDELKVGGDTIGVSGVSCAGSLPDNRKDVFIQGIENLINSASNIPSFCVWFVAEKIPLGQTSSIVSAYKDLYNAISPFAQTQLSFNESETEGVAETITRGFNESVSENASRTVTIGSSDTHGTSEQTTRGAGYSSTAGISFIVNKSSTVNFNRAKTKGFHDDHTENRATADMVGTGTQKGHHEDEAKTRNSATTTGKTLQLTIENRHARSYMELIDRQIERIEKSTASGLWSVASYFISTSESSAIELASIYRGAIAGKNSDIEAIAINKWNKLQAEGIFKYLNKGLHPIFECPQLGITPTPGTIVDSSELAVHLSLPQSSVPGILVSEESSFGRNVIRKEEPSKKNAIHIGCIMHLGDVFSSERVTMDAMELSKHALVCGTTGIGKSNTLYVILDSLLQQGKTTLIIEPAKGEYKQVFSGRYGFKVLGTSPREGDILCINPFAFPSSIDVYEHIDALVETFSACWPMYAAMPQVLKHAILQAYINCGWDTRTSTNPYGVFPSLQDVIASLKDYIDSSDYSNDTKGDYKGSLETRLNSLNEGQIGRMFNGTPLEDETLFNQNVIVDLSRLRSPETESLLMGLLILKLNEFRMSENKGMNQPFRHVTILEEAHNLLKRTSTVQNAESSNVTGMAVERIANSMAEMRTYGEGFIIADQSPSMLDLSTIRNTNTKVIMSLPEKEDQEIAGRSVGLSEGQIHEISRLKKGEAIVYQNSWEEPVKVMIKLFSPGERTEEKDSSEDVNSKHNLISVSEALHDIYTGRIGAEGMQTLRKAITNSSLTGGKRIKIIKYLDKIDSPSCDDCAVIYAYCVGGEIFSEVNGLQNMKDVENILKQYLSSTDQFCAGHLPTFIGMYLRGCSILEHNDFYSKWIRRTF